MKARMEALAALAAGLTTFLLLGLPVAATAAPAAGPFPVDVYVKGSFNGWTADAPMKYDAATASYVSTVVIPAGESRFDISSADGSVVRISASDDGLVELGVPEPAQAGGWNDFVIQVASGDGLRFSVTLNVADPSAMTVLVEPQPGGGNTISIKDVDQYGSGGVNFLDVPTGRLYSVTLNTDGEKTYSVYYNIYELGTWAELARGVAYGVPQTKASITSSGMRITMQPGDWTEVAVGEPLAIDIRAWDARQDSVREVVSHRVERHGCATITSSGQRWEKAMFASGSIGGLHFDTSSWPIYDTPYLYVIGSMESGKVHIVQHLPCQYSY